MKRRTIFLIAGPSGSGKTTLVDRLCRSDLGVSRAITVTTREPRLGETDGGDYYFVSPLTFESMRVAGRFLESTTVYNESYGVPLDAFANDLDLAVIVTPAGALFLSEILCGTHTVFIKPAGPLIAAERVCRRNARNADERLRLYAEEVASAEEFQTIIVNEDFEQALQELSMLVVQSRF
jgi:guanylate kinase